MFFLYMTVLIKRTESAIANVYALTETQMMILVALKRP